MCEHMKCHNEVVHSSHKNIIFSLKPKPERDFSLFLYQCTKAFSTALNDEQNNCLQPLKRFTVEVLGLVEKEHKRVIEEGVCNKAGEAMEIKMQRRWPCGR